MLQLRKVGLVILVAAVHAAVISGLIASKSNKINKGAAATAALVLVIEAKTSAAKAGSPLLPKQIDQVSESTATSKELNKSTSPSQDKGQTQIFALPEVFLTADELDETANPPENFRSILGQTLPLKFSTIEIEFWINANGQTVQINCDGENCTSTISENLQQLLSTVFVPALKDNQPVASRKRILIEQVPTFGL